MRAVENRVSGMFRGARSADILVNPVTMLRRPVACGHGLGQFGHLVAQLGRPRELDPVQAHGKAETRNRADTLAYTTEKFLAENAKKRGVAPQQFVDEVSAESRGSRCLRVCGR